MNQLPEAVAQYRTAIQLDNDDAASYVGLGHALHVAGQIEEAEAALTDGLAHAPEHARIHYQLGLVYLDMKDSANARSHLESALRTVGDDATLRASIQAELDRLR